MKKMNLDDWVTMQLRRKWRWAHKLATTTHDTWTTIALHWDPTLNTQPPARRRTGRPETRWTDDINDCLRHMSINAHKNASPRHDSNHDNNNHNGHTNSGGDNNIGAERKVDDQLHQNNGVPWNQLAADKQHWADMEGGYAIRKVARTNKNIKN